jgi:hypothetical protein
MNRKSVILAANLILFFTSFVLPTAFQQKIDDAVAQVTQEKNNAVIEAIYAADKAGELAQFAQDKYIEILECKNEDLQAKKSTCNGFFEKINYHNGWHLEGINGLGLDLHGLNIVHWTARDFSIVAVGLELLGWAAFGYMFKCIMQPGSHPHPYKILYKKTPGGVITDIDIEQIYNTKHLYIDAMYKPILSAIGGWLCMMSKKEVQRIQRNRKIDALIKKNEDIIAQLEEIQQAV